MEGRIKNNLKECAMWFAMGVLIVLGIIAGSGSLNWAKNEGWLFVIAGIVAIVDACIAGYAFYKKYLKPSES